MPPGEKSRHHPPSAARLAFETLAIAAMYVALGKLGALLAIPPGNVTILWPPSGLALAAVILVGVRALPGIFIGATAINFLSFSTAQLLGDPAPILSAIGIGVGSCLQPWLGRLIWRQIRTEPGFFANLRNAGGFVLLAPAMCSISASVGAASLFAAGLINSDAAGSTWQTWWFGDTIGVLVFAPLTMAMFRMAPVRALALVAVILAGFTLSYLASQHVRDRAEQAWQAKASLASSRLSETFLLWLDLSYASLHSITTLFNGSDFVSEDEFLDAIDGLEGMQAGHLPVTVAFVDDDDKNNAAEWEVSYSTNESGIMAAGTRLVAGTVLADAMLAARKIHAHLFLAAPLSNGLNERMLVAAMRISGAKQKGVLLALINVSAQVKGLAELPGSDGLALRLAMVHTDAAGKSVEDFLIGGAVAPKDAIKTFEVRTRSAGTEFSFLWDVLPEFDGGPETQLSELVLIAGIAGTALISLFLTFLLVQNEAIASRVRERTDELVAKTTLMETVMGAMSQGITAFGPDLKLVAANRRFREIRDYPEELVFEGQDFAALIRHDIEREEFGPGDPERILAEKIQAAERFEQHKFERRRPNGTYIEVQGGPLPGGGFVSTYTDITERKLAEERIAKQVAELDDSRRATLNMMADAEIARKRAETLREEADGARRHLQAAMDNMTDGIYMVDADMCFALFNDRYRELVDLPAGTIEMGKTVRDAIVAHAERGDYGPGELDEIIAQRMAGLASDQPGELQMVLNDGDKYLELRKASVDGGGGAVVIVSDVTNRTKAQMELSSALSVISESIEYASHIQRSILPSNEIFDSVLSEYFVVWEPRDVVGGDMYWCDIWGDGVLIVLGDCTGHGVPGAFMTLIADGALERAMTETMHGNVAGLVQRMHQMIQISLGQHRKEGDSDDGIDLGACYLNSDLTEIRFVGAHFSLFAQHGENIAEFKGTRRGLGYRGIPLNQNYEMETLEILPGTTFVMTTDGLTDQIGGPKRRGFGKQRLKDIMATARDKPLDQWGDLIVQALSDYQGDENRRDDVSLIGFKL